MKFHLSRAVVAIGLGASLWFASVSSFAAPQQSKDQGQTKDQTQQTQSTTSSTSKTQSPSNPQTTQPTVAKKGGPLSPNDDPEMIGKRNINKGLWGKLAAGTEKEVKMGRMLAAQVDKEAKFVDDPIITEYVNRVGQNIVLHSDAKVPFTIKVIDSDEVNAFALPGGFFYVNKGLILAADNEAEVAGVLAHEMSHVRNYDVRLMTVVAALAGAILLLSDWSRRGLWWGGGRGRGSDRDGRGGLGVLLFAVWVVAIILAPIVAQIVSLAVSRQREYLADASGAELTRNPLGLASALEKIDAAVEPTRSIKQGIAHLCIADPRGRAVNEKEGVFANLFATHPPIAKRIALLREMGYRG